MLYFHRLRDIFDGDPGQLTKFLADLRRGQYMVGLGVIHDPKRHIGKHGLLWFLDDGGAPVPFNGPHPGGAVVKRAAQHYPNHALTVGVSSRAKQRIHRRSEAVFPRPLRHDHPIVLYQ